MTVAYAPPLTTSPPDDRIVSEAVMEGPAYVRGSRNGRWHRVRSHVRSLREWQPDDLHETWHFWCGPFTFNRDGAVPLLADEVPTGEPLCGTCEGRYQGWVRDRGLLFTPRDLNRPKVCPGSRAMSLCRETAWNRAVCLVCGDPVKLRGYGGWYGGLYGPQNHQPGPGLVDPCLFHGWRELALIDGTVTCRCGGQ